MSPSVGNFVHDLVEMAKAMETLPQVQAENDRLHSAVEDYAKQVQDREISILNLKNEIEALNTRVRDAEVARDDAELRFLELDEKASKVLSSLGNIQANLNNAVNGLTPPKPEPQPEPIPVAGDPTEDTSKWGGAPAEAPQGQSESNPTSTTTETTPTTDAPADTSQPAASHTPQTVPTPSGPYTGKYYYDHPVYVPLHDWLDGGGTEENYYRSESSTRSHHQF